MKVKKIAIVSHEQILYINVYEVICFESQQKAIAVRFADGTTIFINKSLSHLQPLLPSFFVRVTQCIIINKLYLSSINKREKQICLQGGFLITYTMSLGKLLERIGKIAFESKAKNDDDQPGTLLEIA